MNAKQHPSELINELNTIFPYKVFKDNECPSLMTAVRAWAVSAYKQGLISQGILNKLLAEWNNIEDDEFIYIHDFLYLTSDFSEPSEANY